MWQDTVRSNSECRLNAPSSVRIKAISSWPSTSLTCIVDRVMRGNGHQILKSELSQIIHGDSWAQIRSRNAQTSILYWETLFKINLVFAFGPWVQPGHWQECFHCEPMLFTVHLLDIPHLEGNAQFERPASCKLLKTRLIFLISSTLLPQVAGVNMSSRLVKTFANPDPTPSSSDRPDEAAGFIYCVQCLQKRACRLYCKASEAMNIIKYFASTPRWTEEE